MAPANPAGRVVAGIQPTGRKHLGNYLGAIRQFVDHQRLGPATYFIADQHALTVLAAAGDLRTATYDTAALLLACGLDPGVCTLFRQSDLSEHAELCWILSCLTPWGDLARMHQWKTKAKRVGDAGEAGRPILAGLLFYPVLMAADVLAHRGEMVLAGADQRQHIELIRKLANSFNVRYGPTLPVPEGRFPEVGGRVMDLQDPIAKMSTTGGGERGTVYLLDDSARVRSKLARAVTDSSAEIRRAPEKPGISNLIEIMAAIRRAPPATIETEFAGSRYKDFKDALADEVVACLSPIQERYHALRSDQVGLERMLAAGAERARETAAAVMSDVRGAMGIGPAPHRLRRLR